MSTPPTLDVFSLRDRVVDEYKRFATSFTTIHAPDIKAQVEAINPSYRRSTDVAALVAAGVLDPRCSQIFQAEGKPLAPCEHARVEALPRPGVIDAVVLLPKVF